MIDFLKHNSKAKKSYRDCQYNNCIVVFCDKNLSLVSTVKWLQIWNQLLKCPKPKFTTSDWLPDTTKCHKNKYFDYKPPYL